MFRNLSDEAITQVHIISFVVLAAVPLIVTILVGLCKLDVRVCKEGIRFRFFPFHVTYRKFIFEDIEQYYARQYSPISEYGGWGLRNSFSNGRAYNIAGKKGLQLIFRDGRKILFGSQEPEELVKAIEKAKSLKSKQQ
jgi:hypothetical protein